MKRRIDLKKAAEAEVFGCLALRADVPKKMSRRDSNGAFSQAQIRTISDQAQSLFQFASQAGAQNRPVTVGGVSFDLQQNGSSHILSISKECFAERIIAIGERGTAFANLTQRQIKELEFNAYNPILKKTFRSPDQKRKRELGRHQDVLWADSCSWISPRGGKFWIGTLNEALARRLVRKAKIHTSGSGRKILLGYLRADFDTTHKLSKEHKIIAVETEGGRIEVAPVAREDSNGHRNTRFLREVVAIEF